MGSGRQPSDRAGPAKCFRKRLLAAPGPQVPEPPGPPTWGDLMGKTAWDPRSHPVSSEKAPPSCPQSKQSEK